MCDGNRTRRGPRRGRPARAASINPGEVLGGGNSRLDLLRRRLRLQTYRSAASTVGPRRLPRLLAVVVLPSAPDAGGRRKLNNRVSLAFSSTRHREREERDCVDAVGLYFGVIG